MIEELSVESIRQDGGTQPRAFINAATVDDYAESLTEGVALPPAVVFYDGECYWLADGYHRIEAAEKNDWTTYPCEVRQGTRRDAVLFSVGANDSHGLRRTNQDKRRAVEVLLRDEEWKEKSNNEISQLCGVSLDLVNRMRDELYPSLSESLSERTYKTKHGTTAKMKTGKIGKRSSREKAIKQELEEMRAAAKAKSLASQVETSTDTATNSIPTNAPTDTPLSLLIEIINRHHEIPDSLSDWLQRARRLTS